MTDKVNPHCPYCDDAECMTADAVATWDTDNQKWVLASTYDGKYYCRNCDSEVKTPNWK